MGEHSPRISVDQHAVAAICFGVWLALSVFVIDGTLIGKPKYHVGVYVYLAVGALHFGFASWLASRDWS
jgi:hypothetical protein